MNDRVRQVLWHRHAFLMILFQNIRAISVIGHSRYLWRPSTTALLFVLSLFCLCVASCNRRRGSDIAAITNRLSATYTAADLKAGALAHVGSDATNGISHAGAGTNPVAMLNEDFANALRALTELKQGHIPDGDELVDAVGHMPQEQIANIAHDLIMKSKGSLSTALSLCTNAMQRDTDAAAYNRLCFLAGVACERQANNEADAARRGGYFREAIRYYNAVLDRVERGVSSANAANTAFFLAGVYARLQQFDLAERYYDSFAEYSESIDHNHNNAVFAKYQCATMLAFVEPDRAETICNTLLTQEPNSCHREAIQRVRSVYIPQGRAQLLGASLTAAPETRP